MEKLENIFWFLFPKEPWLLDFSFHYGKILFYIKYTDFLVTQSLFWIPITSVSLEV